MCFYFIKTILLCVLINISLFLFDYSSLVNPAVNKCVDMCLHPRHSEFENVLIHFVHIFLRRQHRHLLHQTGPFTKISIKLIDHVT